MTDAEFYRGIRQKYAQRQQQKRKRWLLTTVAIGMVGLLALAAAAVPLMTGGELPVDLPTTTTHSSTVGTLSTTTTHDGQYTTQPTTMVTDATGNTTETTLPPGIGGDSPYTDNPFAERFWVESPFSIQDAIDLDDYHAWCDEFEYSGGSLPDYEKNVYTFIQKFNIPQETIEQICREEMERENPDGDDPPVHLLTEADIDVLYTKTKAEIYAYFCAEYAVTVGEKAYSAYWFATHTAEEYTAEGITIAQVQKVVDFIHLADLHTALEARLRYELSRMAGGEVTAPTTDPNEVTVIFGDQWSDYSADFQAFLTACGLTKEVIAMPAISETSPLTAVECSNAYMSARFESGLYRHTLSDAWFSPVFSGTRKTERELDAIADRIARWRIDPDNFDKYTRTTTTCASWTLEEAYQVTYKRAVDGHETLDFLTVYLLMDGQVSSYHQGDLNSFCFDSVPAFDKTLLKLIAEERLITRYPDAKTLEGGFYGKLTVRSYWNPSMYRIDNTEPYSYYGDPSLRTPMIVFEYRIRLRDGTVFRDTVAVELDATWS